MERVLQYIEEKQFNFMLIEIGICIILCFFSVITNSLSKKRKKILFFMSISSMLLLVFDRYSYLYAGDTSEIGFFMTRMSNFFAYFFSLCIILGYNEYLQELLSEHNYSSTILKCVRIGWGVGELLAIISQFTGFYYSFDENNIYIKGDGFLLCYIVPLGSLICQIIVICLYHNILKRKKFIVLICVTILPLISSITQVFTNGISFTNISSVCFVIMLYLFAILDTNKALEEANNAKFNIIEAERSKTKLMFEQTLMSLIASIDAKDEYTRGHSKRVAEYSMMIAQRMGKDEKECELIFYSALLHDIGKIGISEDILKKGERLDCNEFITFKKHTNIGGRILKEISVFPGLELGAMYHHERYDGRGYPEKISGEDIPEVARIIAIANEYDILTSKSYSREAYPQNAVKKKLEIGRETEFDPKILDIMLKIIDEDKDFNLRQN